MNLKLILGILGNATSMALFLSPSPTFVRIVKSKTTDQFSGLPYVCTLFNCLLWVLYGLPIVKPNSMLIVTINGFGVAMELLFISLYLVYATKASKMTVTRYVVCVGILYAAIIAITLFALHTLTLRQLVVGSLCVVVAVGMYAAPLSVMGLVIRTKSVEYMPFTLSLCNFLNSAVWTAYSLVTKDIFVAIPNGIGCMCAIVQLALFAIYYKSTKIKLAEEKMEKGKPGLTLAKTSSSASKDLEKNLPSENGISGGNIHKPMHSQFGKPLSHPDVLVAQV